MAEKKISIDTAKQELESTLNSTIQRIDELGVLSSGLYDSLSSIQDMFDAIRGVPDEKRTARFVCAVAAVFPDGTVKTAVRTMEGIIGHEIAGENGFGYDPIFFLPQYGKTSAEISPEEKNAISHRGKALRAMKEILEENA